MFVLDDRRSMRYRPIQHGFYGRFGKRVFDIVVSLFLLIGLCPLMLVIGLVSLRLLGRPLIFRQVRPGFRDRLFTIYKFRTMRNSRSSDGRLSTDDDRLDRFGTFLRRSSLDELPELLNVLRGDMSLAGPRPLLPEYLSRYNTFQRRRHEVKPGITGWAQVNGRNTLTWEQKFELDIWYVEHHNLYLDLKILCLTLLRVLRCEGIGHGRHATMPEFRGDGEQSPHQEMRPSLFTDNGVDA